MQVYVNFYLHTSKARAQLPDFSGKDWQKTPHDKTQAPSTQHVRSHSSPLYTLWPKKTKFLLSPCYFAPRYLIHVPIHTRNAAVFPPLSGEPLLLEDSATPVGAGAGPWLGHALPAHVTPTYLLQLSRHIFPPLETVLVDLVEPAPNSAHQPTSCSNKLMWIWTKKSLTRPRSPKVKVPQNCQ